MEKSKLTDRENVIAAPDEKEDELATTVTPKYISQLFDDRATRDKYRQLKNCPYYKKLKIKQNSVQYSCIAPLVLRLKLPKRGKL